MNQQISHMKISTNKELLVQFHLTFRSTKQMVMFKNTQLHINNALRHATALRRFVAKLIFKIK